MCQGQFAGHVAALGFDYGAVGASTSAARILGNAVYLHPHEPVSVTIYTRSAASVVTDKVSALIVAEGSLRGRSASISLIDDATALATTASGLATDVIIVPPQPDAEPGDMPDAASLWATPLNDFASQGGVLLFLVHGQSSADLLGASDFLGEVVVAAEPMQSLVISSWIDALSVGVLSPFASNHGTYSVTATGPADAMQQVVVSTGAGAPIVVHRVLAPAP